MDKSNEFNLKCTYCYLNKKYLIFQIQIPTTHQILLLNILCHSKYIYNVYINNTKM